MIRLLNHEVLDALSHAHLFPPAFTQYLAFECEAFRDLLHQADACSFNLEQHGYLMYVVEPEDRYLRLPFELSNLSPEYAELVPLLDRSSAYRVCWMPDNDSFVFAYALAGYLCPDMEQWFTRHIKNDSEEVSP